ncbi:hypothetical protein [Nibribacter ruber]|uniref:hypothetical protein n=1 Tax=Nibribacter ruber TaxID=2698458 RepID=UPI0018D93D3D|nr:hypothetical protein [Nibribacter ruber]
MENKNTEPKSLADLIQDPSHISAIINNPAESGMEFYQSLHNKDKSYVAFAAGFGLIAYGLYLARGGRSSNKNDETSGSAGAQDTKRLSSNASSSNQQNASSGSNAQGGEAKELHVKKNK